MWSDNDIDNAFRRLDPIEPEPTPFPLDAWLKLESQLDEAVIARAVRRRLWQFFAAEVAAVLLLALGWHLWPAGTAAPARGAVPAARMGQPAAATTAASVPAAEMPAATAAGTRPQPQALPRPAAASASRQAAATLAATKPLQGALQGKYRPAARLAQSRRAAGTLATVAVASARPRPGQEGLRRPATAEAVGASARRAPAAPGSARFVASSIAARRHSLTPPTAGRPTLRPAAGSVAIEVALPAGKASEAAVAAAASHAPSGQEPAAVVLAAGPAALDAAGFAAALNRLPAVVAALATPAAEAAALPSQLAPVALEPVAALPISQPRPRLYVGLVAAPDVTTVRFADVQAPHLNLGLTLEYQLGPRWRVATGVQRATKSYYARREDYDWSSYPRALTRDFATVDGSCTVVDVPLNLRYDALVAPRYRVFGTAGLSSFFMQHERYAYDYYDNTSNSTVLWERSYTNANQHWFSVLNLAAGYEYGLATHWRLQAEPYVKVPLAGVGAGKVKLLSAGVYFGIKYGF